MKHLLKSVLLAKIGASAVSIYIARRKKNEAVAAIEKSRFSSLVQQLKLHPKTHRQDGFYNSTYLFKTVLQDGLQVEAFVQKQRPVDRTSLNDSLDIIIHSAGGTLEVRLQIKTKPLIDARFMPDLLKREWLGVLYIDSESPDSEIENAFDLLSQALDLTISSAGC